MASSLNALKIRRRLGPKEWHVPEEYGPDGWLIRAKDDRTFIIITVASFDGDEWIHASISHQNHMPTYDELKSLHLAVFQNGWSYQVFTPPSDHVNIHRYCLHLFGRLDGSPVLPDFTTGTGSI